MAEKDAGKNHHQTFNVDLHQQQEPSKFFDDDGRVKRTGNLIFLL